MTNQFWGLDLGGTKIEGVILTSTNQPEPILRLRTPTEADRGYNHVIGQIKTLVEQMENTVGNRPNKIGICTPGVIDPQTHRLKNCNATCLNGQTVAQDIEAALALEIYTSNDANCFALAESRLGAAQGSPTVFGVIIGSGVGGGIVVNGTALYGGQGISGEWGHNTLDPNGPNCYCGRRGCVETILAGPFLEKFYENLSGKNLSLPEINKLAETGKDLHAVSTINRLIEQFGRGIANVINIVDPHTIVLGGGVSNIESLYTKGVQETAKYVFNHQLDTKIVQNKLGDSAGVFGAAMLVA